MKKFYLLTVLPCILVGCINSSTAFTNRSVTYMVTPENIGEHSSVNGSPTAGDGVVQADKTFESAAKINAAQNIADNSSNDQHKETKETEETPVESK